MAEAVLNHQIANDTDLKGKFKIVVDSAGTGAYHEGEAADSRTIAVCRKVSHLTGKSSSLDSSSMGSPYTV